MREHSLEAYHEGMKFEKSLVERGRKDGVGEEREEGRCLANNYRREKRIRIIRYFGTNIK
jgi:hypothetical protein